MAERVDEVADFEIVAEQLAAVATNLPITPHAVWITDDIVSMTFPEETMILAIRMDMNTGDGKMQVRDDLVPEINSGRVVVAAKREIPDHAEHGQVAAITDEIDVVGADAGLDGGKLSIVWCFEAIPDGLHTSADEQSGGIRRDDVVVMGEVEAQLPHVSLDNIDYAERGFISLSS